MKPVWIRLREEKEELIRDLIKQLDVVATADAKVLAGALDYYGFNKGGLAHDDFVVIRRELIAKAKEMIERATAE